MCVHMQYLLVMYVLYVCGVRLPALVLFLSALLYNFMRALLVPPSQNEIFSEACPEVKPDGILGILTKSDHNERP